MSWQDWISGEVADWSDDISQYVSVFNDRSIAVFDDNSYTAYPWWSNISVGVWQDNIDSEDIGWVKNL